MRPWLLALALALAPLGLPPAAAQGPPDWGPSAWGVPPPPAYDLAPPPLAVPAPPAAEWEDAAGVEVLLGLPTGVRLQALVAHHDNHALLLECFAGLDVLIVPTFGAGARWSWAPLCGSHDALALRPGLDVYYLINPDPGLFSSDTAFWLVGADVELVWLHERKGRCGELGLDLGAMAGRDGVALPLVSVFTRFRF